jgi:hypothetical protein
LLRKDLSLLFALKKANGATSMNRVVVFMNSTVARAHELLEGVQVPAPCLIVGADVHDEFIGDEVLPKSLHFGLISSRGPVTTLGSRIKIRRRVNLLEPVMLTPNEAFRKFRSNLELTQKEQDSASSRQKEIRALMDQSFKIADDFLIGSYRRWTKTVMVGTALMPRRLAASHRACPARIVPDSSTRMGEVQNRLMLFIRAAIWPSGCRRGFLGKPLKLSISRETICLARTRRSSARCFRRTAREPLSLGLCVRRCGLPTTLRT